MNNTIFLPDALKAVDNWCVWRLEHDKKGRLTKVPYCCPGIKASSINRNTWSSFETISAVLESAPGLFNGYGLMIDDGFVFIDVDHCIGENGDMSETGKDILSAFPLSYAEYSQSGQGVHIITRGTIPRGFKNGKQGVEMYASGRFCACTGNPVQMLEPSEEQDGINYVFRKYKTERREPRHGYTSTEPIPAQHSDGWIIRHASGASGQSGIKFRALFESGDISGYPSASEADIALCALLAFWCDRNHEQIDRIFSQSKLYRPKWERQNYKYDTIKKACGFIHESLSEQEASRQRKIAENLRNASATQLWDWGQTR